METTSDSAVLLDLTGSGQSWLRHCKSAMQRNPTALAEIADDSPAARALQTAGTRVAAQAGQSLEEQVISYDWLVARAVRDFALSSSPSADREQALYRLLEIHSAANLGSVPRRGEADAAGTAGSSGPVEPIVELLDLELRDRFPATIDRTSVPVLFADTPVERTGNHTESGRAGRLTVEMLASGPRGLHPDPRQMIFLRVDNEFVQALQRAWAAAPVSVQRRCLVWSVVTDTRAASPANDLVGGSLAAAFALALNDLSTTGQRLKSLRPRRLDPTCAVSASLSGANGVLGQVTGLDHKMAAAQSARPKLRVIVAEADVDAARRSSHGAQVDIVGATDVRDALRKARSQSNPRFRTLVALVCSLALLVSCGGVALNAIGRRHADREALAAKVIQSGQLAARSAQLLKSDPVLAERVALAAYTLHRSPTTTAAMTTAITHNPQKARVVTIRPAEDAAMADDTLWLSTRSSIVGYSIPDGRQLSAIPQPSYLADSPYSYFQFSPQGSLLLAVGFDKMVVYKVGKDRHLDLVDKVAFPYRYGGSQTQPNLVISPDGERVLMVDREGWAWLWTAKSKSFRKLKNGINIPPRLGVGDSISVTPLEQRREWAVEIEHGDNKRNRVTRWIYYPDRDIRVRRPAAPDPDADSDIERDQPRPVASESYRIRLQDGRTTTVSELTEGAIDDLDVTETAVSDTGLVAIASKSTITLLDTTRYTTSVVYETAKSDSFQYLRFLPGHRLAAFDSSNGRLVTVPFDPDQSVSDQPATYSIDSSGTVAGVLAAGKRTTLRLFSLAVGDQKANRRSSPTLTLTTRTDASSRLPFEAYPRQVQLHGDLYAAAVIVGPVEPTAGSGGSATDLELEMPFTKVVLWRAHQSRPVISDRCQDPNHGGSASMFITPSGRTLIASSGAIVCRWRLPNGQRLPDIDLDTDRDKSGRAERTPLVEEISGDDSMLLLSHEDESTTVSMLNPETKKLDDLEPDVVDAALAPGGDFLATVSFHGVLRISSLDGTAQRQIDVPTDVAEVTWSSDGQEIAVWTESATLLTYEVASGIHARPPVFERRLAGPDEGMGTDLHWPTADTIVLNTTFGARTIDVPAILDWRTRICAETRPIDPTEWRTKVSDDVPYLDPCR